MPRGNSVVNVCKAVFHREMRKTPRLLRPGSCPGRPSARTNRAWPGSCVASPFPEMSENPGTAAHDRQALDAHIPQTYRHATQRTAKGAARLPGRRARGQDGCAGGDGARGEVRLV